MLVNSGAEAVENAVKIARHATGRGAVVVFDHAFHGRTNLTMAMTARAMPYKAGFGPFVPEVYRVPMSYPFRDPESMTGAEAAQRAIDQIEAQVGAGSVACVVVEPIQGEGGFLVPARGFLPTLAAWCHDNGVVFVADEVQSGFGRTGDWFACDDEGVVPDLVATAKGIAAGMPLGAVTGRAELWARCTPAGSAAPTGAIRSPVRRRWPPFARCRELDLPAAARRIGGARPSGSGAAGAAPGDRGRRGRGAMFAVEFVRPGSREPDAGTAREVIAACHSAGVVVLSCGTWGNVIRLLPPFVIPEGAAPGGSRRSRGRRRRGAQPKLSSTAACGRVRRPPAVPPGGAPLSASRCGRFSGSCGG